MGVIFTSSDNGSTWTQRHSGAYNYLSEVTYGNGIFVAIGDFGTILSSTDGTFWTSRSSGTSNGLNKITYGNGTFVVVGSGGIILQSDPVAPKFTVTKSGNGTVRSTPEGINCGGDCDQYYDTGTIVTLTAAPDAGSYFAGWSGDCTSLALTCKVTMDGDKDVTATFTSGMPPENTWVSALT
jgi:hypothetical protein